MTSLRLVLSTVSATLAAVGVPGLAVAGGLSLALWFLYSSYCLGVMRVHAYLLRCPGAELPPPGGVRSSATGLMLRLLAPDLRLGKLRAFFDSTPRDW